MNLGLLLEMAASGHPDRTALESDLGSVTFGELDSRANAIASLLMCRPVRTLVYVGRNGIDFPALMLGAARAGVPFAPINYRLSRTSIAELIADLDQPIVVAEADYLTAVPDNAVDLAEFLALASGADPAELPEVAEDLPAVLLFTSGTTAKPKAVILRHLNLASYILSTVEFGGAEADEATLVCVPPYHVAAVGSVLSNLYAGRRVVYLPDFDAGLWLDLVAAKGVTSAMVVPTMLARIVEVVGDGVANAPALRLISYGGARMPGVVLERALQVFPTVGFCNAYGLTETSSTLALLGPEEHRAALESSDPAVRARLGSIGRPVPGVEAVIRAEDGTPCEAGIAGQLWVRGAQVSGEYAAQGSQLDPDGWFHTRDLAWADADGYLFIEGRCDDTIIRGGENIAPAEIEEVLHRHPAVKDVAVVGKPDAEWGERIVAVVVKEQNSTVTESDLRDYARGLLRGSRTPDDVVWREELPVTPTGKLIRRQLVQELVETAG